MTPGGLLLLPPEPCLGRAAVCSLPAAHVCGLHSQALPWSCLDIPEPCLTLVPSPSMISTLIHTPISCPLSWGVSQCWILASCLLAMDAPGSLPRKGQWYLSLQSSCSCSQTMVFQRAPSPQSQLPLTPTLFIKGRKGASLVSSLWGNARAWIQCDKMQSKWWFNFDSKPLVKGRHNLALPLYLERAVLHHFHILEGTRVHILLPHSQKWEGFVREVHGKAHKIHTTCLQVTSTIQLLYHNSDSMENATNCFLG